MPKKHCYILSFYIKRIPNAHSGRERIRTLESRIASWPSVLAPLPPSNNNNNNTARLAGAPSEDSLEETEGIQKGALEKNSDVAHETRDRLEDIIEEQSSDTIE